MSEEERQKELNHKREVTFKKIIYHIDYAGDKYEVVEIVKHNIEEYNYRHICRICKYTEYDDFPEVNGFWYHEPSSELLVELTKLVNKDN